RAAVPGPRECGKPEVAEAQAARTAAAEERDLARSGVGRARQEAAVILGDARRAAEEMLARAAREVAEVRRELMRQRNVHGGRRTTERARSAAALDDLAARTARARQAAD